MDGRLVFLPAVVGRILVRLKCKKVSASPFPPLHTASRSDAHWRFFLRRAPAGGASHVPAGLFVIPSPLGRKKVVRRQKIRILFKVLPSRQFHPATPKPSAFIKTFFEKKASKSLPGWKKVIPLQPQTRSNGVIRPALRSEEEVIEKFTYQAASVRIQRKTNRQGLEEKTEE